MYVVLINDDEFRMYISLRSESIRSEQMSDHRSFVVNLSITGNVGNGTGVPSSRQSLSSGTWLYVDKSDTDPATVDER